MAFTMSAQEGTIMGLRHYMCNAIQLLHKTRHSGGVFDVLNEAIYLSRAQARVLSTCLNELCRDESHHTNPNPGSSERIKEVNDYFLTMLDRIQLGMIHLSGCLGITLTVWDTSRNLELYKKHVEMNQDGVGIVSDMNIPQDADKLDDVNPSGGYVAPDMLGYSSEYTFQDGMDYYINYLYP